MKDWQKKKATSIGGNIFQRCDIWWARLTPKPRPVVLVSRNSHLQSRSLVLIAPVSTRIRGTLGEVPLGPAEGLPRVCVADTSSLDLIETSTLVHKLGRLTSAKRDALDTALRFALGLD